MEIIKNSKKAGVRTDRIDPEPWFNRWEACIPIGSKDQPELVGLPCYRHKTCGHLTKVSHDRVPPNVCSWCHSDIKKEQKQVEEMGAAGIPVFDAPQQIVNLKKETFDPSGFAAYLRDS